MYQCPACSSCSLQHDFNNAYLVCKVCNHSFEPKHKLVEDYYTEPPSYSKQAPLYNQYLQLLIKCLPDFSPNYIIDVGGGDSSFLEQSKIFFKNAFHILCEKSRFANCSSGTILVSDTSELAKYYPTTSLYTFFQVVEHVEDLSSFLRSFPFASDDIIMLTLPCNDSIYKILYKEHWKSFSPSHHAHLYSKTSLMLSMRQIFPRCRFHYFGYCHSGNNQSTLALRLAYLAASILSSISNSFRGRLKPPMYYGQNSCILILSPNA